MIAREILGLALRVWLSVPDYLPNPCFMYMLKSLPRVG